MNLAENLGKISSFLLNAFKDYDIEVPESAVPGISLLLELGKWAEKKKAPQKVIKQFCEEKQLDPSQISTLDDLKKFGVSEGEIDSVEGDTFVLLTKEGEQCVNYDAETRFYLDEDDSDLTETDSSSLVPGYEAEVYGEEDSEGCVAAEKVVVEIEEDEED